MNKPFSALGLLVLVLPACSMLPKLGLPSTPQGVTSGGADLPEQAHGEPPHASKPLAVEASRAESGAPSDRDLDQMETRHTERYLEELGACVSKTQAALDGGIPATAEIRVSDDQPYRTYRQVKPPTSVAISYAQLGEIRSSCEARLRRARLIPVIWAVANVDSRAQQVQALKKPDRDMNVLLEYARTDCLGAVEQARSRGASDRDPVALADGPVALAEVPQRGCERGAMAAAQNAAAAAAAADAELAPVRAALKGDRFRLYVDRNMRHFRVFGPGGGELSTPGALAKANVWFEMLDTRSRHHWAMRRFEFRGDRLVSEKKVTGNGPSPASREFR